MNKTRFCAFLLGCSHGRTQGPDTHSSALLCPRRWSALMADGAISLPKTAWCTPWPPPPHSLVCMSHCDRRGPAGAHAAVSLLPPAPIFSAKTSLPLNTLQTPLWTTLSLDQGLCTPCTQLSVCGVLLADTCLLQGSTTAPARSL